MPYLLGDIAFPAEIGEWRNHLERNPCPKRFRAPQLGRGRFLRSLVAALRHLAGAGLFLPDGCRGQRRVVARGDQRPRSHQRHTCVEQDGAVSEHRGAPTPKMAGGCNLGAEPFLIVVGRFPWPLQLNNDGRKPRIEQDGVARASHQTAGLFAHMVPTSPLRRTIDGEEQMRLRHDLAHELVHLDLEVVLGVVHNQAAVLRATTRFISAECSTSTSP